MAPPCDVERPTDGGWSQVSRHIPLLEPAHESTDQYLYVVRRAVVAVTSFLFIIGTVGSNIGPALVDERPLLTLLLSSRNRNLLGSVPFIDVVPYALVGFLRLLLAAVCLYFVGRWYGGRALAWVESQAGEVPRIYHVIERFTDKAGWAAVILMPGSNIVCLFVGHRQMATRTFVALASLGISIKLVILWIGGKMLEEQIRSFLDAIERYQWWIVIGLFGITMIQSIRRQPLTPPDES